jgi:hypothetical protein
VQGNQTTHTSRVPSLHRERENPVVFDRTAKTDLNQGGSMSNIQTNDRESFPIIPDFIMKPRVTVAGEITGINKEEHEAWQKDLEHRRQRGAELDAKRREAMAKQDINIAEVIDVELEALEAGAIDFHETHLKPNTELIQKRADVDRLRNELSTAEARLAEIEARGSSVDRLYAAVTRAESALNGMVRAAEAEALNKLIVAKFGWLAPRHKITPETLKELNLDISIQKLKEFTFHPPRQRTEDPQALQQRMDVVGRKLAALREHIEKDQRG